MGIESFDVHGLILCVAEGYFSELIGVDNVGIGTFGLHGQILYVSEDYLSDLHCVHNVGIETFDLHGLTLHDTFQNPFSIIAQQLMKILFERT